LIKKLLVVDPKKRLSAGDALKHPWFSKMESLKQKAPPSLDPSVLNRLKSFKGVSKLKKAAMNMLVKMADQKSIEQLREDFHQIDQDGTGLINADELKQAIKQSNINIPDD
jgi:calcium-dependent protein kinase